ncbi:endonuclease domain-containing protein [Microbacterium sp. A93]|uniref:endonuclease domain-containing protein n=1 Tax=Microbacterium sp. A93 TaxID=3450716 RepID=UPI003F444117
MPARLIPLPEDLPSTCFSTRKACAEGATDRDLRHPSLEVLSRGIRQRGAAGPDLIEYLFALQDIHPMGVFSHATAAAVWGMWLPRTFDPIRPVHLSKARRAGPRPRRRGVHGHLLPLHASIRRYRGIRVTGPEWTWVQLAATTIGDADLVAAGDSLLQAADGPSAQREPGVHPRSSIQAIEAAITSRTKMKGITRARTLVELLREGADSPQESRLRIKIVDAGITEPLVNPEIILSSGEEITPDLVWRDLKICVQYEGDHHRSDSDQWDRDIERDLRMQADGWIVIRVTKKVFSAAGWARFHAHLQHALDSRRISA